MNKKAPYGKSPLKRSWAMAGGLAIWTLTATAVLWALVGCSATGPGLETAGVADQATATDRSGIVFLRTGETIQYSLRRAAIGVNGKTIGGLSRKSFLSIRVPAGPVVLDASMWDVPGSCMLTLRTAPGATYYLEVAPRKASLAGSTVGGMIGSIATGGHPAGDVAGMLAGSTIESHKKECAGAFDLTLLDEKTAKERLVGLKESS